MKKSILTILAAAAFAFNTVSAQQPEEIYTEVIPAQIKDKLGSDGLVVFVDTFAKYPGGEEGLISLIMDNTVYPKEAMESGITGTVVINYKIDTEGNAVNFKIAQAAHPSLNDEALRVMKLMKKWEPATLGGKPVEIEYSMPFEFEL